MERHLKLYIEVVIVGFLFGLIGQQLGQPLRGLVILGFDIGLLSAFMFVCLGGFLVTAYEIKRWDDAGSGKI